jgi:glyoxylase-like metal-dependent hydrolase (beta-lactamase superfamily II)
VPSFIKQAKFDIFKPDFAIDENFDLSMYGLDARVIYLPGHSKGSIGILTSGGDLFCGDYIHNSFGFNMVDNMSDHQATVEKLKKLSIKTIHPAHGRPVSIGKFWRKYKKYK